MVEELGEKIGGKGIAVGLWCEKDIMQMRKITPREQTIIKSWDGKDRQWLEREVAARDFLESEGVGGATAFQSREFMEKETWRLALLAYKERVTEFVKRLAGDDDLAVHCAMFEGEVVDPTVITSMLDVCLEIVHLQMAYAEIARKHNWAAADKLKESYTRGLFVSGRADRDAAKFAAQVEKEKSSDIKNKKAAEIKT